MHRHISGHSTRIALGALLVLASSIHPQPAHADWLPNGTPMSTDGNETSGANMGGDGMGGVIIGFSTFGTPPDYRSTAFVQRLDDSGVPLWGAGHGTAVATSADDQSPPVVSGDGAGGAIVAWLDYPPFSNSGRIFVQRLSAAGTPVWGPSGISITPSSGLLSELQIVADGSGGTILVWLHQTTDGNGMIESKRIDSGGNAVYGIVSVAPGQGGNDLSSVIPEGDGGAIVLWSNNHVFAQRLSGAGAPLWTPGGVQLDRASYAAERAQGATDGAGGIIATWWDFTSSVGAQRLDSSGVPRWGTSGITVTSTFVGNATPAIAPDGSGGAFIAWEDNRSTISNVYVNRFDAAGAFLWAPAGVRACTFAGARGKPVLASDGLGGVVAAFSDNRGADPDLYASRLSASGTTLWASSGVPVCTAVSPPFPGDIVTMGDGGAFLSWADTQDITKTRAMRVLPDGSLPPLIAGITSLADVPNDQGGWVRLNVSAAAADPAGTSFVTGYNVWRQTPSASSMAAGTSATSSSEDARDLVLRARREPVFLTAQRPRQPACRLVPGNPSDFTPRRACRTTSSWNRPSWTPRSMKPTTSPSS